MPGCRPSASSTITACFASAAPKRVDEGAVGIATKPIADGDGASGLYEHLMFVDKLDFWIGKTLFVPPIVRLCQLTRQSQYAISRLFWFIAALDGFYRAETLFSSIVFGVLSLIMMVTASMRADSPTISSVWFRMLALALLALDLAKGFATDDWAGCEFWLFVLVAEYAATIRTIPPLEQKKAVPARSTGAS